MSKYYNLEVLKVAAHQLLFCIVFRFMKPTKCEYNYFLLNRVSLATVKSFVIELVSKNVFMENAHKGRTSCATVISDGQVSSRNNYDSFQLRSG